LALLVDVELTRRAADRYVARALLFPDLVVEAESRDAALGRLRAALRARRQAGVELVQITLDDEASPTGEPWPSHAGAFPDDELYHDMLAEVERERRSTDQAAR
jgi:hypothetical protein